jgi:lipoprotein-releasing system permease protein
VIWQFFIRYLFSRRAGALVRLISWLCILGVGVGVLAMVVVLSVMTGFGGAIQERLLSVEPHIMVKLKDLKNESTAVIDLQVELEKLSLFPKKTEYFAFEDQDVIIRTIDGYFGGAVARGIEPTALKRMLDKLRAIEIEKESDIGQEIANTKDYKGWEQIEGLKAGEVVIGIDLAKSLGIFTGDEITAVPPESLLLPAGEVIPHEKVVVKRVLRTNLPDFDNGFLFYRRDMSFRWRDRPASLQKGVAVYLPDPYKADALIKRMPKNKNWEVESWNQRNSALFYSLKMEKLLMTVFLGLTLFIGSFSIVTVLVLLGTQKRRDIGILLACGFSKSKTRNLFAGVGFILSSIGVVSGLVIGLIICYILDNYSIIELPDIYYDQRIPVSVDAGLIGGLLLIAALIAFLGSWLPAYLNTSLTPVEALQLRQRNQKK